jgi:hypothetical protein
MKAEGKVPRLSWSCRDIREGAGPVHDDRTELSFPNGALYLVVSGAPAPDGIPALVRRCQDAGWRVVVFSTPAGTRFIDSGELEHLTGEPVRSEYRLPGTGKEARPLTRCWPATDVQQRK